MAISGVADAVEMDQFGPACPAADAVDAGIATPWPLRFGLRSLARCRCAAVVVRSSGLDSEYGSLSSHLIF